jgi:hypothetical protein
MNDTLVWVRAQWDRVLATTLFVAGGVALVIGWVGVSRQALTALQVPYIISGGIGGIFLLGLGAVFWLSADLRDEWRKLDQVLDALGAEEHANPSGEVVVAVDPWADLPVAAAKPARRKAAGRGEAVVASVEAGGAT